MLSQKVLQHCKKLMNIFWNYFWLEEKKCWKILTRSMISLVLSVFVLGLAAAIISNVILQSQLLKQIEVAVVIPEEERETKLITAFVAAEDSTKSICRFCYMEEGSAFSALQSGQVEAVIVFPAGFYEGVNVGENTPPAIYVAQNGGDAVAVFGQLLKDGVSLLQTAEAGVYAVLHVSSDYETERSRSEIGNTVAQEYIYEIFDRTAVFEKSVVSPVGIFDFAQYYFSVAMLMILLICGLNCGALYGKENRSLGEKLKMYGVGCVKYSVIKVMVMTTLLWCAAMLLYIAAGLISLRSERGFLAFEVSTLLGFLPLCMVLASYFHAVYGLVGGDKKGIAVLFAMHLIMLLGSGTLIPAAYLSKPWAWCGSILPMDDWNTYNVQLIFGEIDIMAVGKMLAYIGIGTGIGAVGTWRNTSLGMQSY